MHHSEYEHLLNFPRVTVKKVVKDRAKSDFCTAQTPGVAQSSNFTATPLRFLWFETLASENAKLYSVFFHLTKDTREKSHNAPATQDLML